MEQNFSCLALWISSQRGSRTRMICARKVFAVLDKSTIILKREKGYGYFPGSERNTPDGV